MADRQLAQQPQPLSQLDRMILWEQGELCYEDTLELFQELVDSGLAWQLQGCYGRYAQGLIGQGAIAAPAHH